VLVAGSCLCFGQNWTEAVSAGDAAVVSATAPSGADGCGAGTGAEAGAGADPAIRSGCLAGAGADAVGGVAVSCCWMIALAASVPSVPQAGQFTRTGILPFTGSTSNA